MQGDTVSDFRARPIIAEHIQTDMNLFDHVQARPEGKSNLRRKTTRRNQQEHSLLHIEVPGDMHNTISFMIHHSMAPTP